MAEGACLCGQVCYSVDGPLRPVIACHCRQCRKTSGHYVAATSARRCDVTVEGVVTWYHSSDVARRGFCGICGSSLFWDGPGSHLSIHAGTLDGDPGVRVAGHIFCADKGAYYEIGTDLPTTAEDAPDLTTMVP